MGSRPQATLACTGEGSGDDQLLQELPVKDVDTSQPKVSNSMQNEAGKLSGGMLATMGPGRGKIKGSFGMLNRFSTDTSSAASGNNISSSSSNASRPEGAAAGRRRGLGGATELTFRSARANTELAPSLHEEGVEAKHSVSSSLSHSGHAASSNKGNASACNGAAVKVRTGVGGLDQAPSSSSFSTKGSGCAGSGAKVSLGAGGGVRPAAPSSSSSRGRCGSRTGFALKLSLGAGGARAPRPARWELSSEFGAAHTSCRARQRGDAGHILPTFVNPRGAKGKRENPCAKGESCAAEGPR